MVSKYDKLRGLPETDNRIWNRCGLSESEWEALTPEERVVHCNRQTKCEHKANLHDWPVDLRDSYSHDPYFHTAHMDVCRRWGIRQPARWEIECNCQMCLSNIGLTDEDRPRKVNEEEVRRKWQDKLGAQ